MTLFHVAVMSFVVIFLSLTILLAAKALNKEDGGKTAH